MSISLAILNVINHWAGEIIMSVSSQFLYESLAVKLAPFTVFAGDRFHLLTPSYYKVVVIKVPLQGQNATIDKVLWIG